MTNPRKPNDNRYAEHPVLGTHDRDKTVEFTFDGRPVTAYEGETIAAALVAAGIWSTRTSLSGRPRGYHCGMGHCFECRVTINGIADQRACLIPVREGLDVRSSAPVPETRSEEAPS